MDRDDAILDYIQDRLGAEDRQSFENDMAEDATLAAEVDLMRKVRSGLASTPRHEQADQVWDRLSASIDETPKAANDNRRPWIEVFKYAAAVVLSVAVWQVAVAPRLGVPNDGFRIASEAADSFVLQVKFVETATIGEITALLAPLGGTISDGPGALGLVQLSFAESALRDQALAELSARSDLVELVAEP